MNRTVYFSKVSLNSQDVYDLVDNYDLRYKITGDILYMLKHDSEFYDEYSYVDDDGERHEGEIKYTLSIKDKDESSIYGYLDRTTSLFVKNRDDATGELKTRPVDDTEAVEFYYDVLHEYVAFSVRKRFGRNMFNDAFAKLMNHCAQKENFMYSFYVGTYNEGMSIDEIKESIKHDKNIKQLIITYRPANPDEKMIKKAKEASESDKIKASNATERSVIYKARGKNCIDGSADIIQEDLNKLVELNEGISVEEMTQFSYAEVKSTNEHGAVKSTADSKPFMRRFRENVDSFVEEAKIGIAQILRR
ncbi:hypothetical protein [Butyrivibrio sp. WCE2006]|uniref:hypothetical protein n=1 Tax=Butyrivibrio sp. WCE2006 TaxID=1410611 RepID=UPI0005D1EEC1|nr:hypothetical protein [Butyrivibrio sp. WCE2006]